MLCNLLTGLRGSLLRRGFVIGALDTEALDLCRIADWACFDLRGNVTGPQGADMQSAGKVAWVEFTWAKAWMTSAAMQLGYRVLAVDTDVGFVRDPVPSLIRLAKGPPLRASCGLPEFGPTACTGVMLARMTNTAVQAVMDSTLGIVGSLQRGENVTLFANTTWYGGESVMSYAFATDQPIAMTFRTIFQHVLAEMYREHGVEKVIGNPK